MPYDLSQIKADNPIAEVIGRDVALQRAGREFKALCPIHGEKTPSFTVMPDRGRFHCFGCGVDGDVLDYIQISRKCDLPAACEMLGGGDTHPMQHRPPAPTPAPGPIWTPVMPVPDDVPAPPGRHIRFGVPEHVSRVLNQAGELMHLIYRWPPPAPGEHKVIRPLTFDGKAWVWKWPPRPRPLYGLPLDLGLPVLLVEGEKKRDAAAERLNGAFNVVSWPGGAQGVAHAGWQTLRGLDVVMWPDADPAGAQAAQAVSAEIVGVADRFRLLTPPPAVEQGWDVADAIQEGWGAEQLLQYINTAENVRDPNTEPPDSDPYDPGPESRDDGKDERYVSRRKPKGDPGAVDWGVPVDFFADESSDSPILTQDHVPAALWPFIVDASERMGVEPNSVALTAMVACASVISDVWKVQPKRWDYTWQESARLWGAIVGPPSILKSPVISAFTHPIDKMEIAARERHKEEMRQWRADCEVAKADKEPAPRQPKLDRYLAEGATVEALSELLRDDDEARFNAPQRKVLSRHDEMSEFFGGLDRYKSGGKGGSDRGAYLRLHNGGRYTVDRIGRGSYAVPSWSACFIGGCQPGPIQKIAKDTADDGMLQRFMYAVPAKQEPGVDRRPDSEAISRYEALFPALAAMYPAPEIGSDQIRPITLSDQAHAHRETIDELASVMQLMPDMSGRMKAMFGKWPGLFARLCLTFHMIEVADARLQGGSVPPRRVIQEPTAEMAAAYMRDILLPHMFRAEAIMFSTDQAGHATWIAGHILAHGLERIQTRDIVRNYEALKNPESRGEIKAVMESLATVCWVEPVEPTNFAKPVTTWLVNPAVHTMFAERGKAEANKRKDVRSKVARAAEIKRGTKTKTTPETVE